MAPEGLVIADRRRSSLLPGSDQLTEAVKDEASSGANAAVHSAESPDCSVPLAGAMLNGATHSQEKLRGT